MIYSTYIINTKKKEMLLIEKRKENILFSFFNYFYFKILFL